MTHLRVRLLGPFQVARSGRVITEFQTTKTRALLAYLAAEADRPHRREVLAEMLWPGRPEGAARANLRHVLTNLRHAIGDRARSGDRAQPDGCEAEPSFLLITRKTIQFNIASDASVDVTEFESLTARGVQAGRPNVEQLKETIALYRGSFLEDISIGDSAAFEEWALLRRERLSRQVSGVLNRLAEWYARMGEYERALEYARRRVDLEPWDEERQRQVMRLLALDGQRSGALAQYETCRRVLVEELGVEPEEETIVLYERIRDGEELPAAFPHTLHNLPAPVTPFIGREAELARIGDLLRDPACRLVSLIGPGGSGKTRLALEAAADILSDARLNSFEHGVFFVSLAPLQSSDAIVPTVADAIGFPFYEGGAPRQQLLDYLRQKSLLVIMDNFEHLLSPPSVPPARGERGGADLVTDILQTAPDVKILTTSRTRLNLQSEYLFPVGGMDLPSLLSCEDAEQYSAVELFATGARRAELGFELTGDNVKDVVRVCRLVEGMPLGVLLAAAWTRMLTPAEIADQISGEIERNIDFLAVEGRDVPARQRSMRATLDHSWRLLTEREQVVFRVLSVFRGGFTREAARTVTGASLRELMALIDKSLLHRAPTGRYEVHELLRQYAADKLRRAEKLDQEPAAGKAARNLHCAYYTAALQRWGGDLKGRREKAALAEMDVEIENARAAWDWAAEQVQVERLDQALEALCRFYHLHRRPHEGEVACRTAASRLTSAQELTVMVSGDGPVSSADGMSVAEGSVLSSVEGLRVLARILARQAGFSSPPLGRTETVKQLLRQSLYILEGLELAGQDVRSEKAYVLFQMGCAARGLDSDYEQARRMYEQSLALYRAVGDRWWTATLLGSLSGIMTEAFGNYSKAKQLAEESLAIARAIDSPTRVAAALVLLGWSTLYLGQVGEAERALRESILIHRETGARGGELTGTAWGLLWLGKFDEAHLIFEQDLAFFSDLGDRRRLSFTYGSLGHAEVHLGSYGQVRVLMQMSLPIAEELDDQTGIGFFLFLVGSVALAEGACAEARQLLEESVAVSREIKYQEWLNMGLAVRGYAARGLGQLSQARQHLCEALQIVADNRAFIPSMLVLPAVALFLVDQGEKERAIELYGLASRYGFVANSRWFDDIAGRHIAAIAAMLPPEVVAAAQERGRARDLAATVKELLAELEV